MKNTTAREWLCLLVANRGLARGAAGCRRNDVRSDVRGGGSESTRFAMERSLAVWEFFFFFFAHGARKY